MCDGNNLKYKFPFITLLLNFYRSVSKYPQSSQSMITSDAIFKDFHEPFAHLPWCNLLGSNFQDYWSSCVVYWQPNWQSFILGLIQVHMQCVQMVHAIRVHDRLWSESSQQVHTLLRWCPPFRGNDHSTKPRSYYKWERVYEPRLEPVTTGLVCTLSTKTKP